MKKRICLLLVLCMFFMVSCRDKTSNPTIPVDPTEDVPSEPAVEKYSVTYNIKGHGTQPANLTEVTALPAELPVLTAEGWTFGGWYTDEACTKAAVAGSTLTSNVTLYAKWTQVVQDEPKVEVIKQGESFELEAEASKEINLNEYFSYTGSKHSYEVTTENKDFVEYELLLNKLTVSAVAKGVEKVTVKLGDKTIEFTFTVTVAGEVVLPEFETVNVSYDLNNAQSKSVTLAPTEANGYTEFTYALKGASDGVTISGNTLTVAINSVCEKTAVVVCTLSEELSVEFNVNINVYKTINVLNGSFNNGLEGWTLDGNIGEISEEAVFWDQDFAVNNVGKYFTGSKLEGGKGTLTSNLFKLEGTGYITFMLGAAGNDECYIKIVDENNNVLAVYRNTEFKDMQDEHHDLSFEEQRELIGTEINTLNLIKYKADLSAHLGKMIKIVVVDNATANFGFVSLDEVNCHNVEVPGAEYVLAENQLPDFTEANQLIANKVTAQGDYTEASYNAYVAAVDAAVEAIQNKYITPTKLSELVKAIKDTKAALVLREVELKKEANTEFVLITGNNLVVDYSTYFDTKELSSITFTNEVADELKSKITVAEGKLTLTTTGLEIADYNIKLVANYKGEETKSVTLNVKVIAEPTVIVRQAELIFDFDLYDEKSHQFDLSQNIVISGDLEVEYYINEEKVDKLYTVDLTLSNIIEAEVVVKYTYNNVEKEVSYTVTINVTDTRSYRVANGNFTEGLKYWTLNGEIGTINENLKATYWEGLPINNVGNYFDGIPSEGNTGTLTSSEFVLGGNGYITFMMGGAKNQDCLIKVIDEENNIIAIYRNTEFKDRSSEIAKLPLDEQIAKMGTEFNACNLVKYKADLNKYKGEKLRIVVVDNATSGFGFVSLDEVNTYHTKEIGSEYVLAENQLADLKTIEAVIAGKIEQGDYTKASYDEYVKTIDAAKEAIKNPYIMQSEVEALIETIETAQSELAVREITVKKNTINELKVVLEKTLEIKFEDYFDTNNLSSVTFDIEVAEELKTQFNIENGVLTFTAGKEVKDYTVVLKAIYSENVENAVEFELTIKVIEDPTPVLRDDVELSYVQDKFKYTSGKDKYELDLSKFVSNPAGLELTYTVNEVKLESSIYEHEFDNKETEITVVVDYKIDEVAGEPLNFSIDLYLIDTTPNRLQNGGFENGLEGWTKVGKIGDVSTDKNYWVGDEERSEGYEFGMDGSKMFSAYAPGNEEKAVGTLTSSSFVVGGSGFVTFKLGAIKDGNYVYVDVVNATTKKILARYYNGLLAERTNGVKSGCTLVAYKANLSDFMGQKVFFRISDNADSGYGLFFLDSFITYYENEPEGFNAATPVEYTVSGTIYDLFNGGFEMSGNQGWWNDGEPGKVTNADAFFNGTAYGKEGTYLYSGVQNLNGEFLEDRKGVLTSSVFEVGGSGYITYMLGGGNDLCYVRVIDAVTNEVLGLYRQQARQDAVLKSYVADLTEYVGRTIRIQVVDETTNNWGCVSFDNVVTYYEAKPEGYIDAKDIKSTIKYELVNGSFECGKDGWTQSGENIGEVVSDEVNESWYTKNDDNKAGSKLFSFAYGTPTVNLEGKKGTLTSDTFKLKQNAFVSFRFGGAGGAADQPRCNTDVYIELVKADGTVIATFYNDIDGKVNTRMYAYYYQYSGEETDCFFRIVDNSTGNYGGVVVDDFRVNLEAAPEGFNAAVVVKP